MNPWGCHKCDTPISAIRRWSLRSPTSPTWRLAKRTFHRQHPSAAHLMGKAPRGGCKESQPKNGLLENGPFINGFPLKTSIQGFSSHVWWNQRVQAVWIPTFKEGHVAVAGYGAQGERITQHEASTATLCYLHMSNMSHLGRQHCARWKLQIWIHRNPNSIGLSWTSKSKITLSTYGVFICCTLW